MPRKRVTLTIFATPSGHVMRRWVPATGELVDNIPLPYPANMHWREVLDRVEAANPHAKVGYVKGHAPGFAV